MALTQAPGWSELVAMTGQLAADERVSWRKLARALLSISLLSRSGSP